MPAVSSKTSEIDKKNSELLTALLSPSSSSSSSAVNIFERKTAQSPPNKGHVVIKSKLEPSTQSHTVRKVPNSIPVAKLPSSSSVKTKGKVLDVITLDSDDEETVVVQSKGETNAVNILNEEKLLYSDDLVNDIVISASSPNSERDECGEMKDDSESDSEEFWRYNWYKDGSDDEKSKPKIQKETKESSLNLSSDSVISKENNSLTGCNSVKIETASTKDAKPLSSSSLDDDCKTPVKNSAATLASTDRTAPTGGTKRVRSVFDTDSETDSPVKQEEERFFSPIAKRTRNSMCLKESAFSYHNSQKESKIVAEHHKTVKPKPAYRPVNSKSISMNMAPRDVPPISSDSESSDSECNSSRSKEGAQYPTKPIKKLRSIYESGSVSSDQKINVSPDENSLADPSASNEDLDKLSGETELSNVSTTNLLSNLIISIINKCVCL